MSRRYAAPVAASIIVALSTIYYLATSVQNAFFDVIDVTRLLFSIFYILTALAATVYYRRRIVGGALDFLSVGLLQLAAVVPRLDLHQVAGQRAVDSALVVYRHRRGRGDPDVFCALHPALHVLPDRAGTRAKRHLRTGGAERPADTPAA